VASAGGNSGTGSPISITVSNPDPTVNFVLPANGATVSGTTYLDAVASPGVSHVAFALALNNAICGLVCDLGDATPTAYGWLYAWNTKNWPNGSYPVVAEANYPNEQQQGTIPNITVTVANTPPTVVVPASGSTVSGTQVLDCLSPAGTSQVQFWVSGGTLSAPQLLGSATPSIYGWLYDWTITSVSNGAYSLYCSATYPEGETGQGPSIPITVAN
jgi:hypothetical protein